MKKFLVTYIIFLLLIQISVAYPEAFSQENTNDCPIITTATIDEVFYMVKKDYYQDITEKELLINSMKYVEELLSKEGLITKLTLLPDIEEEDLLLYTYRKNLYQILEKYGKTIDRSLIMKKAIAGMLEALNDPYTVYFDEEEYKNFNSSLSGGDFYGIGVLIKLDKSNNNLLTVVEPIKNTPAHRGGIEAGDIILKINNIATAGLTLDESATLLEGPRGSKVELIIKRKEEAENLFVEVVRDKIHISSVETEFLDDKIGYIKLSVFGKDTNEELDTALKELEKEGAKGYILDLRNNGGGYVAAAIDVCSKFMPPNAVVVYINGKEDKSSYNSYGSNHKNLPLAILVNEYSASASEITAGALQDSEVAKIIGTKTFGKGIVQTIYKLDKDGGALKMTTASYMTPEGRNINKKGLEPDIIVEMDSSCIGKEEEDIQLKEAKDYLLEQIER